MRDMEILNGLKDYLTKEYMRLANEKEEILSKKMRLEAEEKKVKDMFFDRNKVNKIRQMFSPIEDFLAEYHHKEKDEEKKNQSIIQDLDEKLKNTNMSMEEIKEYMTYIQRLIYDLNTMLKEGE